VLYLRGQTVLPTGEQSDISTVRPREASAGQGRQSDAGLDGISTEPRREGASGRSSRRRRNSVQRGCRW
jgi:hypothetical protein